MNDQSSAHQTYQNVTQHVRETKMLGSINALLEWDQQTMLPAGASEYRAGQVAYLAGKIHQRETDPKLGDWLQQLSESELATDAENDQAANIRELAQRFRKRSQLPLDLVKEQAALHSRGQQTWIKARKANDFGLFQQTLEQIFALKRHEAQATRQSLPESECLYDALLDDYEPGVSTRQVTSVLAMLRDALIPLIESVADQNDDESCPVLNRSYPIEKQKQLVKQATAAIGFDYERGRLDIAAHPFCTETGPNDVRMTTRYDANFFSSAFFGSLHEAGHGMYEQGLREDQYGLPVGTYCSLGIHESQSRLWENLVGRSAGFWQHFFPVARTLFPASLGMCPQADFLQAINKVRPSLIRVEADEATYNLHIIIRFELEQAVLDEELIVADLPDAWNEKYRKYLGIEPEEDANGILQDIHWSAGLIGYFPTYCLGNIYASIMFDKALAELGDLETRFAQGCFSELLNWLGRHVHRHGNRYSATQLMEHISPCDPLDPEPLIKHLRNKVQIGFPGLR